MEQRAGASSLRKHQRRHAKLNNQTRDVLKVRQVECQIVKLPEVGAACPIKEWERRAWRLAREDATAEERAHAEAEL